MNDKTIIRMINKLTNATTLLTTLYLDPSADPAVIANLEEARSEAYQDLYFLIKKATTKGL